MNSARDRRAVIGTVLAAGAAPHNGGAAVARMEDA
jgi:hypothetical protein